MKISTTRLLNFRDVLTKQNLRLTDVATRLGKAPAQVSAFGGKNPTKGIGDQIAREIEKALGLASGYLDFPHHLHQSGDKGFPNGRSRRLPILGPQEASLWCNSAEEFDSSMARGWIDPPQHVEIGAFAFLVEGVSMEPQFIDGDLLVVDPSEPIMPGHLVAVVKQGSNALVIRQLLQEGGDRYLRAINPDWPDRISELTSEWSIKGKARWKISSL